MESPGLNDGDAGFPIVPERFEKGGNPSGWKKCKSWQYESILGRLGVVVG